MRVNATQRRVPTYCRFPFVPARLSCVVPGGSSPLHAAPTRLPCCVTNAAGGLFGNWPPKAWTDSGRPPPQHVPAQPRAFELERANVRIMLSGQFIISVRKIKECVCGYRSSGGRYSITWQPWLQLCACKQRCATHSHACSASWTHVWEVRLCQSSNSHPHIARHDRIHVTGTSGARTGGGGTAFVPGGAGRAAHVPADRPAAARVARQRRVAARRAGGGRRTVSYGAQASAGGGSSNFGRVRPLACEAPGKDRNPGPVVASSMHAEAGRSRRCGRSNSRPAQLYRTREDVGTEYAQITTSPLSLNFKDTDNKHIVIVNEPMCHCIPCLLCGSLSSIDVRRNATLSIQLCLDMNNTDFRCRCFPLFARACSRCVAFV